MDYQKLNFILKSSLLEGVLLDRIENLEEVAKLATIMLNSQVDNLNITYKINVDLNTSINNSYQFLNKVNEEYGYYYLNILRETDIDENYSVIFKKMTKDILNSSKVDRQGQLVIFCYETLEDTFSIMHEMVHKFSTSYGKPSMLKKYFAEIPTLTMELLLEKYLTILNKYPQEEIIVNKNISLVSGFNRALETYTEYILLKIYRQNEIINQELIDDYLKQLPIDTLDYQVVKHILPLIIEKILKEFRLSFFIHQRYIIASLTSFYLNNKINEDGDKLNDLFTLIHILGKSDFTKEEDIKILNSLDLPFKFDGKLEISDENISLLNSLYQNEVNKAQENQKKYKLTF